MINTVASMFTGKKTHKEFGKYIIEQVLAIQHLLTVNSFILHTSYRYICDHLFTILSIPVVFANPSRGAMKILVLLGLFIVGTLCAPLADQEAEAAEEVADNELRGTARVLAWFPDSFS